MSIEVGNFEKKIVSELNNELYLSAVDILDTEQHSHHIGWSGVGLFIDWLEANYNITRRE